MLSAALAAGALFGWAIDRAGLDWQPSRFAAEPWRAWSAAFVHLSPLHLGANLVGLALVAALGTAVPLPRRCALAWFIAWPLTQAGLLFQPALGHYGGLSGVLHAGVAVAVVHLLCRGTPVQRRIGLAMFVVLCLKLLHEAPWDAVVRHPSGWDIAVTPGAHLSGALAGALCAAAAEGPWRACPPIKR